VFQLDAKEYSDRFSIGQKFFDVASLRTSLKTTFD